MNSVSIEVDPATSLKEAAALIGVPLRRRPWNTSASGRALRAFARGIGSRNPLYLSRDYSSESLCGGLPAHPTWLYSIDDTIAPVKFPWLHAIFTGTDWHFERYVMEGDSITAECKLLETTPVHGEFSQEMLLQKTQVTYTNQRQEAVATARSYLLRTNRAKARERGLYRDVTRSHYTPEDLQGIGADYDSEEVRGAKSRYWDDVKVGDDVGHVVKGPLTSEDIVQFVNVTHGVLTFGKAYDHRRRHPGAICWNEKFNMPDTWEDSLFKPEVAEMFGFPDSHDAGIDRVSWADHLVTNWMGDTGFLRELSVRLLRPMIYADTVRWRGTVTEKRESGGVGAARLQLECRNQGEAVVARGTALVELPSRRLDLRTPLVPSA